MNGINGISYPIEGVNTFIFLCQLLYHLPPQVEDLFQIVASVNLYYSRISLTKNKIIHLWSSSSCNSSYWVKNNKIYTQIPFSNYTLKCLTFFTKNCCKVKRCLKDFNNLNPLNKTYFKVSLFTELYVISRQFFSITYVQRLNNRTKQSGRLIWITAKIPLFIGRMITKDHKYQRHYRWLSSKNNVL